MADIKQAADNADMIVNGHAFTHYPDGYRVLNLKIHCNTKKSRSIHLYRLWFSEQIYASYKTHSGYSISDSSILDGRYCIHMPF